MEVEWRGIVGGFLGCAVAGLSLVLSFDTVVYWRVETSREGNFGDYV